MGVSYRPKHFDEAAEQTDRPEPLIDRGSAGPKAVENVRERLTGDLPHRIVEPEFFGEAELVRGHDVRVG